MLAQRKSSPSPSPSRRSSLSSKLSAFGAMFSRTLTSPTATVTPSTSDKATDYTLNGSYDSMSPVFPVASNSAEHSPARGRETFSTGRGGLGNIRQASVSRDARPATGPDDFSVTRGRERVPNHTQQQVFSTGRGGAGNLRSPSRDPNPSPDVEAAEKEVIREYVASHEGAVHSTGRGGLGNMSRSRSRDASIPRFSTGRGGAGNMVHSADGALIEAIDEEERKKYSHHEELHSTGRGGAANITSTPEPPIEHPHHDGHPATASATTSVSGSTGRGGLGNISRNRSSSRQRT